MQTKKILYCLMAMSILLLNSCIDQDDFDLDRLSETTINPTIEANLLSMDFTARDFLEELSDTANGVEVLVQQDSTLLLRITSDFEVTGEDLGSNYFNKTVELETYSLQLNDITVPDIPFAFTDDYVIAEDELITVPIPPFAKFSEEEVSRVIDSVLLSEGVLNIGCKSALPCEAVVVLKSNNIRDNETYESFSQTYNLETNAGEKNFPFDMTGHKLLLDEKAGSDSSYLYFTYSIKALTNGKKVTAGTYGFNITIGGDDLTIDIAWGQVGNPTVPVNDISEIDYFGDSTTSIGNLGIKDIIMKLDVINYTGIRPRIDLSKVYTKDKDGTVINLFEDGTVRYIEDALSPNQTRLTTLTLNPKPAAVAKLPDQFVYDLDVVFGDGDGNAFVRPSHKYLDIHSVIDIPVIASITDFISTKETDALDFLQDDDGVGDYIDSLVLKLNLSNTFPAELVLQLYTVDQMGTQAQLLNKDVIVKAAPVGADGKVTAATQQKENVDISQIQYQQLRDAEKVIFKIMFNTPTVNGQQPEVLFRSDSKLSVQLGVKVNSKISF